MTTDSTSDGETGPRKRLVIVAGVGRSGTSLFTTILGMAGFHVPQPEVRADSTNPKGFGESQWVVDFHGRQLRSRRVSVWDSRPAAWEQTESAAADPATVGELRSWLAVQFVGRNSVVIKDPRVGWFLPLWRKAAEDIGVDVSFAALLRHPAEAVSSALKWYGDWQTPASRSLSWVNIMLETEHATRGDRRVFVRYEDLLTNWSGEVHRIGVALDIPVLIDLPDDVRKEIEAFVDPTLHRNRVRWDALDVPPRVRDLVEDVWRRLQPLAGDDGDAPATRASLDEARTAYAAFYAEAETIAQSSITAAQRRGPQRAKRPGPPPPLRVRLARRLPVRYRRRLRGAVRSLRAATGPRRGR